MGRMKDIAIAAHNILTDPMAVDAVHYLILNGDFDELVRKRMEMLK